MRYPLSARRLKEALDDKNMKPQELSNLCGVNKSSLSQYINGSHAPSNLSATKIAKVLDVSPLWLMGFPDSTKIDIEEMRTDLLKTRLEYMALPSGSEAQAEEYEAKLSALEEKIKKSGLINDRSKRDELIDKLRENDADYASRKISAIREESIEATKALEMYRLYEQAPPHIQAAVESLLKGAPPHA